MRGIRPTAQARHMVNINGWDAGGDELPLREYIGIVEAHGGAVQKTWLIERDVDIVLAGGQQNLIHLGGADGPHVVDGVGLVGAVEELGRFVGAAVQGLVFPKTVVQPAEPERLLFGQGYVSSCMIRALVLR